MTPEPVPAGVDGPPGVDHQRDTLDPVALVAAHERAFENTTISITLESRRQALFNVSQRDRPGRPIGPELPRPKWVDRAFAQRNETGDL